ncbi:hypothetical protein Q4F19_12015 [Sphingomonas sp. BIUV-7]|uniref:NHL repeat-containing protein n=1 Tax=Sphingomonas natans TaxID=3063330 RepID=A0ABT8YAU4_9SPHN|nr:hypothetical protein [Sphingomonas sp. BIUV-7]MDO6415107.1 hypothetical protein [Sphingomonas sp. BIUV-7]
MTKRVLHKIGLLLAATLAFSGSGAMAGARPPVMPVLTPDANWLKPPAGLLIGNISAVAVDAQDHVWILHRPRTAHAADGAKAAPPILAFARDGTYLRGFGGPGAGYDWPANEHSLAVDRKGRVWITGNSGTDDMLLVFAPDGHFLRQIGRPGASKGDLDTANLHAPADIFVDDRAHEVYVADGYGNRRVIVFDSETGAFKRMWGAFGAAPPEAPAPEPRVAGASFTPETGDGPQGFSGVHGVELSRDGKLYVADRYNQRVQVFTPTGKYLGQVFVDRNMASPQTASGIAFSADAAQRYLYVSDSGNSRVLVFDRARLALLGAFGSKGSAPGQFSGLHLIATDSHDALYTAELTGQRVQRFIPKK